MYPNTDTERELFARGARAIIGLDEAGRGAVAGPVSVAAFFWGSSARKPIEGVRDSKLLSEKKREEIGACVRKGEIWGFGCASALEIEENGIMHALKEAAARAIAELYNRGARNGVKIPPLPECAVLIDGKISWLPEHFTPRITLTKVKADQECASVAAASVVAKTGRDALMRNLAATHPQYAWDRNKGYGSRAHYEAIREHGFTEEHRTSWIRL